MGKNLQNGNLVMRDEKVAFYEVPEQYAFVRMEGFTSMSTSKSATEHSRKYVDERSSRTDTVGYEESISYSFDRYDGNAVQDDIVTITDEEKVGKQATRRIIQVDMKTLSEDGTTASGRMRSYSVVPDGSGDDANVLTYSGNLKNNGEWENVTVTSSDDWQTAKLSTSAVKPKLKSLAVESGGSVVNLTPTFSAGTTSYTIPSGTATAIVEAVAENTSLTVIVSCNGESYITNTVPNHRTNQFNNLKSGDYITITVTDGSGGKGTSTYKIKVS
ncbi:cadherin-like beta sandwich domain-containing protein [Ruminococcus sp.]|uniref:cadherin-like beta sandwich domain-containing protein n=1 Tax=Ruminococcus sp. TaxID=41978 RepID=UPI0025DDA3B6|nr:cadherin-like beta sandwich domain-containing protein [Ruminococcus sp.]